MTPVITTTTGRVMQAPDNTAAAALSMLVGGSGALSKFETTVLLTMDEAQEAMGSVGGTV